ncbi:MAG: hypothetical protein M1828_001661 [Chrysothrix sp. TS-e1954]|nr:MAG: hypothetical protein M1828_001661 [Chrysothrix sp. TS-e1954]
MALTLRPLPKTFTRSLASKSATEATRFTSTGPHASSKPSSERPVAFSRPVGSTPYASTIDLTNPPPPNETPQQKVHRLREAALRMKADRESTFDKIVRRGRIWADRAHHTTVAGLVGVSLLSMMLATYSLGDMILYNRRKRKAWYSEQQTNYDRALERAHKAEADGTLTGDLALILNHERAIMEWEIAQEAKKGPIKRALEWVFGGLATEEPPGGKLNLGDHEVKVLAEGGRLMRVDEQGKPISDEGMVLDVSAQQMSARNSKSHDGPVAPVDEVLLPMPTTSTGGMLDRIGYQNDTASPGGMLDAMAEQTASTMSVTSRSLWDRIRGK